MKTGGELEAAISDGVSRFEQDYFGRGPQHIYEHLIGDLLVIRLQGVLASVEQHLQGVTKRGREDLGSIRIKLTTPSIERQLLFPVGDN